MLLSARSAEAQDGTCAMLQRPEETPVPSGTWDEAETALATALRDRGLIVLLPRDARLRMMGQPMEGCADIDCAPEVNRFLGTTMAVRLELIWARGRVTALHLALIGDSADRSAGGDAVLERDGSIAAAVGTALAAAWDRWAADQQGQLTVTSTPDGAFVELDGTSLGRTPVHRLVPAGIHSLRVTLEGYVTDAREITIDAHEARELAIELHAEGEEHHEIDPPPATTRTETRPHWANFLVGGALVAAAIPLMIRPLDAIAREGTVVETHPDGSRTFIVVDPAVDGTLLAFSAACLIGGVVFLAAQPITETVTITVTPTSAAVSGEF